MREILSLFTHLPLYIATLRCTDKNGHCLANDTSAFLDPDAIYTISRHETTTILNWTRFFLYVACEITWRANLCAQEILFIRRRSCAWRVAILRVRKMVCFFSQPVPSQPSFNGLVVATKGNRARVLWCLLINPDDRARQFCRASTSGNGRRW